ncbi:hypothetical protein DXG03_005439 [Asterophora parasitica]|uniref:Uncharacterized protein n=1 Tax=Asterophora parasitica TaxID=117018 RepID=A0A9P7KB00_9AGAR|nr:hypothetical protein DXG03_005439 [Asterophora parasitica]
MIESNDAGPLHLKGKVVDPYNWSKANLSGDELDPEVQAQILQFCKVQKKGNPSHNDSKLEENEAHMESQEVEAANETPTHEEIKEQLRLGHLQIVFVY